MIQFGLFLDTFSYSSGASRIPCSLSTGGSVLFFSLFYFMEDQFTFFFFLLGGSVSFFLSFFFSFLGGSVSTSSPSQTIFLAVLCLCDGLHGDGVQHVVDEEDVRDGPWHPEATSYPLLHNSWR